MAIVVRSAIAAAAVGTQIRTSGREVDPELPVYDIVTMGAEEDVVSPIGVNWNHVRLW